MKLRALKSGNDGRDRGALFRKEPASSGLLRQDSSKKAESSGQSEPRGKYPAAYAGMYVIMLLIFIRPHEVMPGIFGPLPLVKIAAVVTILVYLISKLNAGENLITWSPEFKMMLVIGLMGLMLAPIAASPGDSINVMKDTYLTLLILFVLMTTLIDTRRRLRSFLLAMMVSGFLYSVSAMKTFLTRTGNEVERIKGWGTQLENPNDLACVLALLMPFSVYFLLTSKGKIRLLALITVLATFFSVMFTFSRSGFLGLILAILVMVWKIGRKYRMRIVAGSAVLAVVLFVAMPGSYRHRISTIFNPQADQTNSAQERQELMKVAANLAVRRSVLGLGMGNFHIYSFHEKVAHNSFLEIMAELGIVGLLAYLGLIFYPLLAIRRIERESLPGGARPDRELNIMAVCFQASIMAYLIYGFFGSVQYYPYLYFMVAYMVSLRRIREAEAEVAPSEQTALVTLPGPKGVLWKQQRLRGAN